MIRNTALLLALAAIPWVAGCSDDSGTAPPVAPPPAGDSTVPPLPAPEGPREAWLDDRYVLELAYRASLTGDFTPLEGLSLPPRVSAIRVGVTLLHEQLRQLRRPQPGLPRVLDALDALSRAKGGADAGALGPLVVKWRTWTAEQTHAERDLAGKATLFTAEMQGAVRPDPEKLASATDDNPPSPPGSPAGPSILFARAAAMLFLDPQDGSRPAVTRQIREALETARAAYDEIGWPGGFALQADLAAARRLEIDPTDPRGHHLTDLALGGYGQAGDEVRIAQLYLDRARRVVDPAAATVDADALARAGTMAREAARRLRAAGVIGEELVEALSVGGAMAQMRGDHDEALRLLGEALDEAARGGLGPDVALSVTRVLGASLVHMGRYQDAVDRLRAAVAQFDGQPDADAPLRTLAEVDETLAVALLELDRPAEAAQALGRAAERYGRTGDPHARDYATVHRGRALLLAGDDEAGRAAIQGIVSRDDLAADIGATAAMVYLDRRELPQAQALIERFGQGGGASIGVLRARLAAYTGRTEEARALFARAVRSMTGGGTDLMAGLPAAEALRHAAELEEEVGDLAAAAVLRMQAAFFLEQAAFPVELDRARAALVAVQCRRGRADRALAPAVERMRGGPPRSSQAQRTAELDLFLVRLELGFLTGAGMEEAAEWAKDLGAADVEPALAAAEAFLGDGAGANRVTGGEGSDRMAALAAAARFRAARGGPGRLASLCRDVARHVGDVDPVLSRMVAHSTQRRLVEPDPAWRGSDEAAAAAREAFALSGLRRGAREATVEQVQSVLGDGAAFVLVEDLGATLWVATVTRSGFASRVVGRIDAGVDPLRDLVARQSGDPSALAAAARSAWDALAADVPQDARVVVLSPSPHFGFLPLSPVVATAWVTSATEFVDASARSAPERMATLDLPDSLLAGRHAVVSVAPVADADRTAFLTLVAAARAEGLDVASAVREARSRMRATWLPPQDAPPRLPPWAALVLRGAP